MTIQQQIAEKTARILAQIAADEAAGIGAELESVTPSADEQTQAALNLAALADMAENLESAEDILKDIGAHIPERDELTTEDLLDITAQD